MVKLLTETVIMESPSADAASQEPLFQLLESELRSIGFRCRRFPGQRSGGQLLAMPRSSNPNAPRQLLLGHCDTVWPKGTLEKMPFESRDGQLHGPGVYDMKAGLVQSIRMKKSVALNRLSGFES